MSKLNQTSFQKDGYKRVFCKNCLTFLKETRFGDAIKEKKCKKCKLSRTVYPPRLGTLNGRQGAFWAEEDNSCFTTYANKN